MPGGGRWTLSTAALGLLFLAFYAIKDSNFSLYSLVERAIREVRLSKEQYRAGEDVTVTVSVENRDAASPRDVRVGWVLHPIEPGPPDITVVAPTSVALPAGGTVEVSRSGPAAPDATGSSRSRCRRRRTSSDGGEAPGRVAQVRPEDRLAALRVGSLHAPGHAVERRRVGALLAEPVREELGLAIGGARWFPTVRDLRGTDFAAVRAYQEFPLSQLLDEAQTLEFRVGSDMRADLWIDRIRVEFTLGTWYPRPIVVADARR